MNSLLAAAIALAALIAGCATPPDPIEEVPNKAARRSVDTDLPEATWSGCEGFATSFNWVGYNERFEPPPSPGWQPGLGDNGAAFVTVLMYGLDCQRFSLGRLERGPIQFFIEVASIDSAPDSCMQGQALGADALESIWVNDADVAAFLRDAYGMPAYLAEIEAVRQPGQPYDHYLWTLMGPDGAASTFDTLDGREYSPFGPLHFRFFWWNEASISAMDWVITEDRLARDLATTGTPQPPLIMGDWPTDYASFGVFYKETEAAGTIARFEDLECNVPRS